MPDRKARAESGRALRKAVPRSAQAEWRAAPGRAGPVEVLLAQERGRIAELLPRRHDLMAASPLAFLRGAAAVMAADLAAGPHSGLRVQACGDCHLANFGAYASPEGVAVFDINDFDETLPAPFEWDLKRLAVSLVLAGRQAKAGAGIGADARVGTKAGVGATAGAGKAGTGKAGALAGVAVRAYGAELERLAAMEPLAAWGARVDLAGAIAGTRDRAAQVQARARMDRALQAGAVHYGLLEEAGAGWRLRDGAPGMFRLPRHDPTVRAAFEAYQGTLQEDRQVLLRRYRLADWAFKVVGVGSVGTFCAVGLFLSGDGAPLLLQIKQAERSVLSAFAGASAYANQGERVVTGQRMMQAASDIFLGWAAMPAGPVAAGPAKPDGVAVAAGAAEPDGVAAAGGARSAGGAGSGGPGKAAAARAGVERLRAGAAPALPAASAGGAAGGVRDVYVRRMKDARMAAAGTEIEAGSLASYAALCGRTLARAHARSGDAAALAGYVGGGAGMAKAVAAFAVAYADQATRDWEAFAGAVASGQVSSAARGR